MRILSVLLLTTLFFLACNTKKSELPATAPTAAPEVTSQAVDTNLINTFVTDNKGNRMYMTFDNEKGTCQLKLNGETIDLKQEVTASGIRYSNETYTYEEHQGDIMVQKNGQSVFTITSEKVPYTMMQNYFVKNTYKPGQLTSPKITDQKTFESLFGAAATMGKKGKPTVADFSKQFVVAIIGEQSDKNPTIEIANVTQSQGKLKVLYRLVENKPTTFKSQPVSLLLVDNKYTGEVVIEKV